MGLRTASAAGRPSGVGRVEVVVVAGASVLVGVGALAAVLGAFGWWRPQVVWPLVALIVGLSIVIGRRVLSGDPPERMPRGLLVVVLLLTTWYGVTHAEQVLPRRDAGSNLQAAIALATQGSRRVPVDPAEMGGAPVLAVPGVTLESPGFYAVGVADDPAIEPQFVIGVAGILSLGWWAAGATGAQLLPALAMGLALLGVGALVGRLRGPPWGALAAGVLGAAYPMAYVARSTFSEPFALLLLVAGAISLVRALERRQSGSALLAGVLVAGSLLLRIDTLREIALLTFVLGIGLVLDPGRRRVIALALASLAGTGLLALGANQWHSPRYLDLITSSLTPALWLWFAGLLGGPLVGVVLRAVLRLGDRVRAVLPAGVAWLTIAVALVLASRPLWLVERQGPEAFGVDYVASTQAAQGLAVDGTRTYAEDTVGWLAWYVGWPTVVAAAVVAAVALRRLVREWVDADGELSPWCAVLVVAYGSTVLSLWRPGITPDHPWADRRLVIPLLLVVVLTVAGVSGGYRSRSGRVVARVVAAAMVVLTGWGVVSMVPGRVEWGSGRAVEQVCARLVPGDVVVAADDRAANEWPQVIRGMCGFPALALTPTTRADPTARAQALEALRERTAAGGRRLVVLTTAGQGEPVARVVTRQDPSVLTRAPRGTVRLAFEVWLSP